MSTHKFLNMVREGGPIRPMLVPIFIARDMGHRSRARPPEHNKMMKLPFDSLEAVKECNPWAQKKGRPSAVVLYVIFFDVHEGGAFWGLQHIIRTRKHERDQWACN